MQQHADIVRQPVEPLAPDLEAIKAKMKATWEDGDYASFADAMADGAVEILENWNIPPGKLRCRQGSGAVPGEIRTCKAGLCGSQFGKRDQAA